MANEKEARLDFITFRVNEEEKEQVKEQADKLGIPVSSYIKMTIKMDIDRRRRESEGI